MSKLNQQNVLNKTATCMKWQLPKDSLNNAVKRIYAKDREKCSKMHEAMEGFRAASSVQVIDTTGAEK